MANQVIAVTLSIDVSELEQDLERIESGELELPTVSAVRFSIDGEDAGEIVVWLSEA
jgi:hypothetical protein